MGSITTKLASFLALFAAVLGMMMLATPAHAQSVAYAVATADTFMRVSDGSCLSNATYLTVSDETENAQNSLFNTAVRFAPAIPEYVNITSANVRFYSPWLGTGDYMVVAIYGRGSFSPGATGDCASTDTTPLTEPVLWEVNPTAIGFMYTADITPILEEIMAEFGSLDQVNLVFEASDEAEDRAKRFASIEYHTAYAPRLEITYDPFSPTPTPSPTPAPIPAPKYCWSFENSLILGDDDNIPWAKTNGDETPQYETGWSGQMLFDNYEDETETYSATPLTENVASGYTLALYPSGNGVLDVNVWSFGPPSTGFWDGSTYHEFYYTTIGATPPVSPIAVSRWPDGDITLATAADGSQTITGTNWVSTLNLTMNLAGAGLDELAFWDSPLTAAQLETLTAGGYTCAILNDTPPVPTPTPPPPYLTPTPVMEALPTIPPYISQTVDGIPPLPPAYTFTPSVDLPTIEIGWSLAEASFLISILRYIPQLLVNSTIWPIAMWTLLVLIGLRVVLSLSNRRSPDDSRANLPPPQYARRGKD